MTWTTLTTNDSIEVDYDSSTSKTATLDVDGTEYTVTNSTLFRGSEIATLALAQGGTVEVNISGGVIVGIRSKVTA